MKKAKNKLVRNYHTACLKIAETFWDEYYSAYYGEKFQLALHLNYFFPVGGVPSDTWEIEADQWWSIEDMATAIEHSATKKQLEEWYDSTTGELDEEKRKHQNLNNFLKYGWVDPKPSKEEMERLKKSVDEASALFVQNLLENKKK
jgi:hypothetical protein